jgi:hypothetical protein
LPATVKFPLKDLNPPLWLPVTFEPVKRISESGVKAYFRKLISGK